MKTAVIGVGNMGSKYASILFDGRIDGMELSALTRMRPPYNEMLKPAMDSGIPVFDSADDIFRHLKKGDLKIDSVVIATPHISHEDIAVKAFAHGLNVLTDKPAGVYSRQARNMDEAAESSGKVFSIIFNQRTSPVYIKLKEILESGKYGELKRVNWIVTDWYRPEKYYKSSSWHAKWKTDGGGVLLNQAPHNLDLLQWLFGMPSRVQAFCKEGHFHDIEVEDDVTAYFEWDNGATGVFITSTGEAPGSNRLEISLEEATIICENGRLKIGETFPEMKMKERDYRAQSTDYFGKIKGTWHELAFEKEEAPYEKVLQSFSNECNGAGKSIANGSEGRKSLLISNAIYLSSWEKKMINIPVIGSDKEIEFEQEFEGMLKERTN